MPVRAAQVTCLIPTIWQGCRTMLCRICSKPYHELTRGSSHLGGLRRPRPEPKSATGKARDVPCSRDDLPVHRSYLWVNEERSAGHGHDDVHGHLDAPDL